MEAPRILIQFDTDPRPSVFDAVVAIDAEVDHLLSHGAVGIGDVRSLVHGAMFTRGPEGLRNTAIFIGGSDAAAGEALLAEVQATFFGPIRVSVMLDGNGSNTTAAAAVLCAARHVPLDRVDALVLGGTGPVGGRVARLLLGQGATVRLASRDRRRAESACAEIAGRVPSDAGRLHPVAFDGDEANEALTRTNAIFGCGAAGVQLLSQRQLELAPQARVAIDLNAVPPAGIDGIAVTDKQVQRGPRIDYGAIGVGGLKMRIHRAALRQLFTRNDLVLDAEQIFAIGREIEGESLV